MSPWLAGRAVFLDTIEQLWDPRPLSRLTAIEPDLVPWLQRFPELTPATTELGREFARVAFNAVPTGIRWVNLLDHPSAEGVAARSALVRWRNSWGPRASGYLGTHWVMDAALHSVVWKAITQAPTLDWAYSHTAPAHPLFVTNKTGTARARAERAHDRRTRERFGDTGNVERDAEWTARWLVGASDNELALADYQGTEDRVKKARSRFMKNIGFTLVDSLVATNEKR